MYKEFCTPAKESLLDAFSMDSFVWFF